MRSMDPFQIRLFSSKNPSPIASPSPEATND